MKLQFLITVCLFLRPTIAAAASACDLISQTDAAAALGAGVSPPAHLGKPGGDQSCRYAAADSALMITVSAGNGREKYEQAKARARNTESVPSLGDEAVYWSNAAKMNAVMVRKGDKAISIALIGGKSSKAGVVDLARKAVSRM